MIQPAIVKGAALFGALFQWQKIKVTGKVNEKQIHGFSIISMNRVCKFLLKNTEKYAYEYEIIIWFIPDSYAFKVHYF